MASIHQHRDGLGEASERFLVAVPRTEKRLPRTPACASFAR
ncbi:hypothetical protein APY03_6238 [Variovorax sp. WDL1]|nr:hypothetical protein APY03_6238 [Variovorax sp. WDL1]